jgi:uncharacterized protein YbjQ (UPF0145 family)
MKIIEIAKKYGLDADNFEHWLKSSGYQVKFGFTGSTVDDGLDTDNLASKFKQDTKEKNERLAQEQGRLEMEKEAAFQAAKEKAKAAADAEIEKRQAMASMLITSGFNFDGYTITKYSGYISGDSAVSMDRPKQGWLGGVNKEVGEDLLAGLVQIRRKALEELKEAAYALGCNAVIGVDFDYITMDPETATSGGGTLYLPFLFAVTANGNAVVIEKR